jgi:hypothetical protein
MKRRTLLTGGFAAVCLIPLMIPVARADDSVGDIILTELERRLIASYYQQHYEEWDADNRNNGSKHKNKELPPGLAKKGTLPPGLYKQLVRNGSLPPGLEARSLPDDLSMQLPPRPSSQRLVIVDDKVLLVQAATNVILDVLTVAAIDAIQGN